MKQQNEKNEINTLDELNKYVKQLNKSFQIITEDFDPEPTTAQLDKAVAASKKVVSGAVGKAELVGELKTQLAQKPPPTKDPLQARKDAAWRVFKQGEYIGGAANQPHVHLLGNEFHLKLGSDRYNIYQQNKLRQSDLKDARTALSKHALKDTLNPAIDRALLECNLTLDTY
ncbi:MAG TPA: hypothetical protein VGF23_21885 [Gaiellaceae bacterium]|jgi:hypothetical protein